MNNDLIRRSALKEAFEITQYNDYDDLKRTESLIDNAPTVELDESVIQEVLNKRCMTAVANEYLIALHGKGGTPQGEWIYSHISSGYFCDKCGSYSRDKTNFCSKCGTMMQKGGAV